MKTNLILALILVALIAAFFLTRPVPQDSGIADARSLLFDRAVQDEMRRSIAIEMVPGPTQLAEAQARHELDRNDLDWLAHYELPETVRVEREYVPQRGGRGAYSSWHVTSHGTHPAQSRVVTELRRGISRMHRGEVIIEGGDDLSATLLAQYGLDEEQALRLEIYTHRNVTITGSDGQPQQIRTVKEPLLGLHIGRTPARTAEARENFMPVGFLAEETEARFVRLARIVPGEGREEGRFVYDTEIRLVDNVPANLINLANVNEWIDLGVTKVGDSRMRLEDIYRIDFSGSGIAKPFSLQRLGGDSADALWASLEQYRTEQQLGVALADSTSWYVGAPGLTLLADAFDRADDGDVRMAMSEFSGYQALAYHSVNETGPPEEPYLRVRIYPAQELMRVRRAEQVLHESGLWNAIFQYLAQTLQQNPDTETIVIPIAPILGTAEQLQMDEQGVENFLLKNLQVLEPIFDHDDDEDLPREARDRILEIPYGDSVLPLAGVRFNALTNDPNSIQRHLVEVMHEILPNAGEVIEFHDYASMLLQTYSRLERFPQASREYRGLTQQLEQQKRRLRHALEELRAVKLDTAEDPEWTRADELLATAERKAVLRTYEDIATTVLVHELWDVIVTLVREQGRTEVHVGELLERAKPRGLSRETVADLIFTALRRQCHPLVAGDLGVSGAEAAELEAFVEETRDGDTVRIVAFDVPDAGAGVEPLRPMFVRMLRDLTPNVVLSDRPSERELYETLEQTLAQVLALVAAEEALAAADTDEQREQLVAERDGVRGALEELIAEDVERFAHVAAEIGKGRARIAAAGVTDEPATAWDQYQRYHTERSHAVSRFWRTFYDAFVNPHELIVVANPRENEEEPPAENGDEEEERERRVSYDYRITTSLVQRVEVRQGPRGLERQRLPFGFWYEMTEDVAERWAFSREAFLRDDEEDGEDVDDGTARQPQTQPAAFDLDAEPQIVEAPANPRVALLLRDESGIVEDGVVVIELFEDLAPNAVASFLALVEAGYYDGTAAHHFNVDAEIRFGDATTREGDDSRHTGPGFELPQEFDDALRFDLLAPVETADELRPGQGRVAMLAAADGARAHGSQFMITLDSSAARNEQHLTPFGQVVEGMHVLVRLSQFAIVSEDADGNLVPADPVRIVAARVQQKRDHAYEAQTLPLEDNGEDDNGNTTDDE